jgi:hypothetical protein
MWDMVLNTFGGHVVKLVSNSFSVLFTIFACSAAGASHGEYGYSYNFVDSGKVVRRDAAVFIRAPFVGECIFSIEDGQSDVSILMSVTQLDEFVVANAGIWTLYLPKAKTLPKSWVGGRYEFRYMGEERIAVGRQWVIARKIGSFGESGLADSTELWVSDQYGVVAYRPMNGSGRFVLRGLPRKSFLECDD